MNNSIKALAGLFCVYLCLSAVPSSAEDWPQWRGPERDGTTPGAQFDPAFGIDGVEPVWTAELGVGFTGITVSDGRAFTAGYADGHTLFYCFDAVNGEPLWFHRFQTPIYDNLNVGGPSGTPAVAGDRVYHMARNGMLHCYGKDGGLQWARNLPADFGVEVPTWGFSGSPVIIGEVLYLDIGRIIAINKDDGTDIWATDDLTPAYSTPAPFTYEGTDYLAVFPGSGLYVLERATGNIVAHHEWTTRYGVNAATPVIFDNDKIFISSDYNTGCAVLRFTGDALEMVWENRRLKNQMCTSVYHDGYLYGFNSSVLTCIDAQTGERAWDHAGLGRGTVILVGQTLVVLADNGTVLTAPVTPDGFVPITNTRVVEDTEVWTSPTFANGMLYVRGCRGRLECVDVRPE